MNPLNGHPARPDEVADLKLLLALSERLAAGLELRPILDETLKTAVAVCGTGMGLLSLCPDGAAELELGAALGFRDDFLATVRRVPPGGACGTCFERGERVVVADTETDPAFAPYRAAARAAGFRAVHSTPLVGRAGTVVGVLSTHFSEPRRPSDREAHLMDRCARQAAAAIENAQLLRRTREELADRRRAEADLRAGEERHRFLAELAAVTQALTDPAELMAATARLLAEHLDVDRCAYAEVEDEGVYVITGDHPRGVPSIVGRWPVAAFGAEHHRLMLANEPYVVADADADPRIGAADLPAFRATAIRAVVCVPLHKAGRFTAAMAVHRAAPRRWTAAEVELVATVAGRCWEALERARVERTLRASEARYRAIVEATPECVKLVAADGTLLQMNPAGLAMVEADDPAAVIGGCVYDVVAPEHRAAYRAFHERVCRGAAGTLEFDVIGLKGTRRHLETAAVPLPAPGGGFVHLAVTRDATGRVEAARALAESRARFDYAVRVSGVGYWFCDLPFAELMWDARVKEHFWLPPDARVTTDTFYACLHPDDRERTRLAIEASIRDRAPYDIDYRTVDPAAGAVKWVRAMGGAVFGPDGTPTRFDGVTLDITERKRAVEALRVSEERHRQLADNLPAGFIYQIVHGADGVRRFTYVSGGAEALCGVPAADVLANPGLLYGLILEEDRDRVRATEETAFGARERFDCQFRMRTPTGEVRWLHCRSAPRDLPGGGAVWDGVALDLTERRLAEEAVREADRKKDDFIALLAHELRNPLTPIRNGLQVMRLSGGDIDAVARARAMMDRQLTHMVRLIDDLLDVSRISRNKMELRRGRVLLADAVGSAVEAVRPLVEAAGHELAVALPPGPVFLDADLTRLAQVFSNLLANSARYTERGGRIWFAAERRAGEVVVTVRDTGIGIPADAIQTIFDMFSQVDRSFERGAGGLGIGLTLVKGLVEMHGGTVTAESPGPGRGSTFTVRLPAAEGKAAPADPEARDDGRAGGGRRVLVVDDHRDGAESMAEMLALLGDEARTAHDGLEAVEAAEAFRPHVILMDLGMPRLSGLDATRRIRARPWGKGVTIVALTGWGQDGDRERSREAGCDAHLVKPVSLPDLERVLKECADAPAGRR